MKSHKNFRKRGRISNERRYEMTNTSECPLGVKKIKYIIIDHGLIN